MKRLLGIIFMTILMLGIWTGPTFANDEQQAESIELTLNDAIFRALTHSKEVKKANLDIERAKEAREDAKDIVDFIPTGVGPYVPEVREAYTNLLIKDLEWQMSKRSLTAAEDAVALNTCQKYWAVQQAQRYLKAKELAFEQARADLRKAKASFEVGLINEEALLGAQTLFKKAKGELEAARNELAKAYAEFNDLVGLKSDECPVLTEEATFSPLEVTDLQSAVQRTIEQNPQVWQAEHLIMIKDKVRYLQDNWSIADIDMKKAELDVGSLKDNLRLLGRTLYYAARSAEESYSALVTGVELARESLRVTKLKYEVGMATEADVIKAEKELAEKEKSLYDVITQHAYLKLAFQKPWAYLLQSTK